MAHENGLIHINCPLDKSWSRIEGAMERSEAARSKMDQVAEKVKHLDALPIIAERIQNTNRNNTFLLGALVFVILVNAVLVGNIAFRISALGGSVEVNQK